MTKKILRATHGSPDKPLKIGNLEIPCYVLEDGTRVLSGRGMQASLALGQRHGTLLKSFLAQKYLTPFINNELAMVFDNPIRFIRPGRGGRIALGYEATILTEVCDAILSARESEVLPRKDMRIAKECEILTRAFAKVGIIALVDEATGYQYDRARKALEEILDKFISKELRKWAKTFPDEFYEEMFRLRGWKFNPFLVKRPTLIGKLTNNIVYDRLTPGVLHELKRVTPKDNIGRHKHKLHQRLTEDVGHPRLREHLAAVIALMKAFTKWDQFYRALQRSLPRWNEQMTLDLPEKQ